MLSKWHYRAKTTHMDGAGGHKRNCKRLFIAPKDYTSPAPKTLLMPRPCGTDRASPIDPTPIDLKPSAA